MIDNFPILYEDDQLLVINKPYGVVVNRARTVKEPTVQDWASSVIPSLKNVISSEARDPQRVSKVQGDSSPNSDWIRNDSQSDFYSRSGIVHRLDKETSGCLILAKTPAALFKLQAAFKERRVHKMYIALIHGKLVPETGEINAPVGRLPWNREQFGVVPGGKEAYTKYKVSAYYTSDGGRQVRPSRTRRDSSEVESSRFTLVELFPQTGRTHQLRVHMKYLGFPIVGDYLYAGRKQQRDDRVWCPRVFLHAAKIEFPHPVTRNIIKVTSPLPPELKKVLSLLQE